MSNALFGMIGLGTMGRNFLLNVAEHGFPCVGFDLDAEKRQLLVKEGGRMPVGAAATLAEFIGKLAAPRSIMLLVPAGKIVDSVIDDLLPHLEEGDLIIDGGNSHFTDTERREAFLTKKNIGFLGVGVSGGEEGARHGPSIMPGGRKEFYARVAPILEAVSAKVNGEPCVAYMGTGSAGHFVKMVHNGIEYGLMQILAETYDFMHRVLDLDGSRMSEVFSKWNSAELNSFLVEITADVLRKTDKDTGEPLVEMILDTAGQKGTGKWTSQAAMDFGVPIPTIDSAVSMRQISAQKEIRGSIAIKYTSELTTHDPAPDTEKILDDLKAAVLCSFIVTYAQGMSLLHEASIEKNYGLNLADIARIWRGGCIIRSELLEEIRRAYTHFPDLPNLVLDDDFASILKEKRSGWQDVVTAFNESTIPALCISSAMAYLDAFRSERLPANLIQAQRDFFGAHTYQRTDKEGTFHTPDWDLKAE